MTTNPEAIRFWNEANNYAYLPMITVFTWEDIHSEYDLDTYDQAEAQMDQFMENSLGYSATYDEILAAFEETHSTSLSIWNGYYFLFDDTNEYHILAITDDAIQLQVYDNVDGYKKFVSIPSTNYTFNAGTLILTGDISGSLTFSMPTQPDLSLNPGAWLATRGSYQRQCAGTITVNANTPDAQTLNLMGKVGSYTPVGAKNSELCDPIGSWMGLYNAMAIAILPDQSVSSVHPEQGLTISQQTPGDPNSPIVITLPTVLDVLDQSTLSISTYQYFNNSISWDDTLFGDTAGQLMFSLQLDGTPTISGRISVDGQDWYVTAYLRSLIASLTQVPATPTALYPDVQTLDTGFAITTESKDIPYGLIGTAYPAFTLQASGGSAPYTWSNSTDLPQGLTLSTDGKLSGTPTVDKKGGYTCSITVTDKVGAKASKDLIITIVDSTLTIATTQLLDATVYDDYSVYLDATGGDPSKYTWTLATDSTNTLPSGLTLDSNGWLHGKATEVTGGGSFNFKINLTSTVSGQDLQTSKMFTLKLIAAFAPKDIMTMITACFNIFVGGGIIKLYMDFIENNKKDAKDKDKEQAGADYSSNLTAVKDFVDQAKRAHQEIDAIRATYNSQGKTQEFTQKFGDLATKVQAANLQATALESALNQVSADKTTLDNDITQIRDEISKASGDALKELQQKLQEKTTDLNKRILDLEAQNAQLKQAQDNVKKADTDPMEHSRTVDALTI